MAILTDNEIYKRLGTDIIISPFNISQLNPNSYNITLNNEIQYYDSQVLDFNAKNSTISMYIPEEGLTIRPGKVILARSNEYTETHNLVPIINGRSSVGRLGLFIHVTAGFGDIGFKGYWTLELVASQPVTIYPNMKIAQLYYNTIEGVCDKPYQGKYNNNTGIQASEYYKEVK